MLRLHDTGMSLHTKMQIHSDEGLTLETSVLTRDTVNETQECDDSTESYLEVL